MSLTAGFWSAIALSDGLLSIIEFIISGFESILSIICWNIGLLIIELIISGFIFSPPIPDKPPPAANPGKDDPPSPANGLGAEVLDVVLVVGVVVAPKPADGAGAGVVAAVEAAAGFAPFAFGAGLRTK